MTKNNKMAKVAEMLGVKLGEEFKLEDTQGGLVFSGIYRMGKRGLEVYTYSTGEWLDGNDMVLYVLRGDVKIKRFSKSKPAEYHADHLLPLDAE